MKTYFLIVMTGLMLFFPGTENAPAQKPKKLTFTQFPAKKMTGRAAAVDLKSHPQANEYRTRLRDAAKGGVNFAGSFIIVTWGCGTRCSQGAVIDAKTGVVYFPEEIGVFSPPWGDWAQDPIEFQPNSRLLIIRGKIGTDDEHEGIYHLEWTGRAFKKIRFREVRPQDD